ncbi:protein kinase [Deinococcus radiodurans]|nr:protein kinase [Deinococcus radiodurans]
MTLAGQLLGNGTRLVRVLGHGSHSVVYLAVTGRGQVRAVKLFPPELSAFAAREYEHGAGLLHPRLAPVLGQERIGAQPALLMAYARGAVLFERYRRRPALQRERQAYLLTLVHLLEALAYLHERGVLHRDVKPDNIVVEEDGSAKLVDYDLSGPLGEDPGALSASAPPPSRAPRRAGARGRGRKVTSTAWACCCSGACTVSCPNPASPRPSWPTPSSACKTTCSTPTARPAPTTRRRCGGSCCTWWRALCFRVGH